MSHWPDIPRRYAHRFGRVEFWISNICCCFFGRHAQLKNQNKYLKFDQLPRTFRNINNLLCNKHWNTNLIPCISILICRRPFSSSIFSSFWDTNRLLRSSTDDTGLFVSWRNLCAVHVIFKVLVSIIEIGIALSMFIYFLIFWLGKFIKN